MEAIWCEAVCPGSRSEKRDPFWIAIRDRFGQGKSREIPSGRSLIPQGSLVLDLPAQPLCPGAKIAEAHMQDNFLRLEATQAPGAAVIGRIFGRSWRATVDFADGAHAGRRLLVLNWDALTGRGALSCSDEMLSKSTSGPLPVPSALPSLLMRKLISNLTAPDTAAALALLPIATRSLPLLPPDALLQTSRGDVRAQDLTAEASLITLSGRPVKLLNVRQVNMPALGPWQPFELRAPYFEAQKSVILPQYQELILHGSDVQYMFGHRSALLPLSHLNESNMIRHPEHCPIRAYVELDLEQSCAARVNGVPLEMAGATGPRPLPRLTTQDLQTLLQFRGL